jgi:amino acid transporter
MREAEGNGGQLERGLGLFSATALNMLDMIGVGPFITIPLMLAAMGGPQAMLGWIFGLLFALCDGLVWAELGASMPQAGGSYRYLLEIFGSKSWGRFFSFLFLWQLSFSAPLSIASGCIGLARYAGYLCPALAAGNWSREFTLNLPLLGAIHPAIILHWETLLAIATVLLAVFLLFRGIAAAGAISRLLWVGVMATIGWVVFGGLTHFNAAQAFDFPAGAFTLDTQFFHGLGLAMLVAAYDYWGYYNVCFLGGEVRRPERTIPRAVCLSILAVGLIYVVMNISILGVLPWRELAESGHSEARMYVISLFMERIYGHGAAVAATLLVIWTAFASVFSLLLGYSRVPYAAARDGNYFRPFARLHAKHKIPHVSLLALGLAAIVCCFFRLSEVIAALVVIRISVQFLVQILGLLLLRWRRPEFPRPWKMWLYPLPALLAAGGFLFVLFSRPNFWKELRLAAVVAALGAAIFFWRSWHRRLWPWTETE